MSNKYKPGTILVQPAKPDKIRTEKDATIDVFMPNGEIWNIWTIKKDLIENHPEIAAAISSAFERGIEFNKQNLRESLKKAEGRHIAGSVINVLNEEKTIDFAHSFSIGMIWKEK